MICDHPDCTGKHRGAVVVSERCPAATERIRARSRERLRKWRRNLTPERQEAEREASRIRAEEWRNNMPGIEYARWLLKLRRHKALKRMAIRNAGLEEEKRWPDTG